MKAPRSAAAAFGCSILVLAGALPSPASAGSGTDLLRIVRAPVPPAELARADTVEFDPAQRYPWRFPRSTVDRPDLESGPQVHVVYLVASDFPDEHLDELGVIEDSIHSQNQWFREQSGGRTWRFDTFAFKFRDGNVRRPTSITAIDVTFVQSTKRGDELDNGSEVADELRRHGLNQSGKRYLSYVASEPTDRCGDAFYPLSDDPTTDGQFAQVYIFACGERGHTFAASATDPAYVESVAQQELIHNDGMAPVGAPHTCWGPYFLGHICVPGLQFTELDPEGTDVMKPAGFFPLSEETLDRGHDDYYMHPWPFRDLEDSPYLEDPSG